MYVYIYIYIYTHVIYIYIYIYIHIEREREIHMYWPFRDCRLGYARRTPCRAGDPRVNTPNLFYSIILCYALFYIIIIIIIIIVYVYTYIYIYIYIYTRIYSVTQHHDKYDHVETTVTDAQIMPLQFYFVTQLFAMGLKGGWSGGGGVRI